MELRRLYIFIEETYEEGGRHLEKPLRRVAAAGVVRNPCASKYVDDLTELYDISAELGEILARRLLQRWVRIWLIASVKQQSLE